MIIGICGKSGSGKSTISNEIKKYKNNVTHLDIDKVGHYVLTIKEVKEELVNSFGESIITNNSINRKELGDIVFNSRLKMKKLNDITWKYMEIEINKFIENNKDKIIILDWLLLPLTDFFKMCDVKILMDTPYEIRKIRVLKRDNITEEKFDLRDSNSIEYNKKDFDIIVKNNDLNEVKRMVKKL